MYYNLTAIILKRQDFKDDDLLITTYSEEKGKLILQAKGAKKIRSKLAGHLEPITLSRLNITLGKNIDQLIGAQIIKSYAQLKNNLKALGYANYFIELIDSLTHENHPDKNIYELLEKSLNYLNTEIHPKQSKGSITLLLARISFGFKLLYLLGFNPSHKAELGLKNQIDFIIQHRLAKIGQAQEIIENLKELNQILDKELEEHLEKELKSKEFLKQLTTYD
jgi:DNA repair protein RecO